MPAKGFGSMQARSQGLWVALEAIIKWDMLGCEQAWLRIRPLHKDFPKGISRQVFVLAMALEMYGFSFFIDFYIFYCPPSIYIIVHVPT